MNQAGADAEALAQRHLEAAGLHLLARNWRCRGGELDLVMRDADTLVFVEVRKRTRSDYGSAVESVGTRKQARLIHAAKVFLSRHPQHAARPARFDVVAIDGTAAKLDWLRAAFEQA